MMFFFFLVLSLLLIPSWVWAATTPVNCSSASTVTTALTNASSGDIVQCIFANGGWSSGTVTTPDTKNITLDGNGVTVSGSGGLFIASSATYTVRVTNFIWDTTTRYVITSGDGYTNTPWRFDHVTFGANSTEAIMGLGSGPGLIDHLTATNMKDYQQMIEPEYQGPDDGSGWTTDHTPGSANAIYIEDSTFSGPDDIWDGSCVFQLYYGARIVARYNTVTKVMFEVHGSEGAIGGRWWEFYKNTFSTGAICIRAGSGVSFGNTGSVEFSVLLEEDSGYPALYQVGRGKNQALYPAYVWSDVAVPQLNQGGLCSNASAEMVQLNRDVYYPNSGTYAELPGSCTENQAFWVTDRGGNWDTTHGGDNDGMLYKCDSEGVWQEYYTPYTYPHPLQGGGSTPTTLMGVTIKGGSLK